MGESLRDQLLRSGLVKPAQKRAPQPHARDDAGHRNSKPTPVAARKDVDLARAWALRERVESAERQRARADAAAQAQARRELVQRVRQTLQGKSLNLADADLVRHFEYGGRIRRVHVDAAQLAALNAGELGVVQLKGAYALVARTVAEEVRGFAPDHVALLVDPGAQAPNDGVPDDLTW